MMTNPIYRMNDGVAYVFERREESDKDEMPFAPIKGGGVFCFEELSIGADDYTVAKGEQAELSVRIRIHRQEQITNLNIVKIKDIYYEIWRVRHTVNKQRVPVTDITLSAAMEELNNA
jgi:hypothetical protein